ncbi:MAG: AgmX/PglI C-terminal domain-containing protein [Byssovorax sp.]
MRAPLLPLALLVLSAPLAACSKPAPPPPPPGEVGVIHITSAGVSMGEDRLGDAPRDAVEKIAPLFQTLKDRREDWKTAHPEGGFPGAVTLDLGPDLTCNAAMSAYMTAMFAGYPNIVMKQGAVEVSIPGDVPKPPTLSDPVPGAPKDAFAVFHADGNVELKPSRCLGAYDAVKEAELGATVKEWCGSQEGCLGGFHLRCEAGIPMSRVMAVLATLRKSAPKMLLATAGECKPGDRELDLFNGVGGFSLDKSNNPFADEERALAKAAPPPTLPPGRKPPVASVREGAVSVSGGLSAEEVSEALKGKRDELLACQVAGLMNNPNLQGRVAVKLEIGKKGAVMSARNGGSDMPDAGVVSCVVKTLLAATFPAKDKVSVVVYPVMLSPKG